MQVALESLQRYLEWLKSKRCLVRRFLYTVYMYLMLHEQFDLIYRVFFLFLSQIILTLNLIAYMRKDMWCGKVELFIWLYP